MKYSIVNTDAAEIRGIKREYHNVNAKKDKMVVNENELRKVDENISKAAALLGGDILTYPQLCEQVKIWNDEQC